MGRQRTINDQAFWRSPMLANATQEDKIALLHLLTSPDSNITGCYPLIPRIAGAEIGWSAEQWLAIIERLESMDLVVYQKQLQYVWVKIWWQHHAARQITGPKLRAKTARDLECIPQEWRAEYLDQFASHCADEQIQILMAEMSESERMRYGYHIDQDARKAIDNYNNQPKDITETYTQREDVDATGLPEWIQADVLRALQNAKKNGLLRHPPQKIINEIARQFEPGRDSIPRSAYALTFHLAQHLDSTVEAPLKNKKQNSLVSKNEINEFKNRCFSSIKNVDSFLTFYKIVDCGFFYELTVTPKNIERRSGYLNIDLVGRIRQGLLVEISDLEFEKIDKKQMGGV